MEKLSTGITGLDAILQGGYPVGRPTLLKGGPGSGKTIFCQLFVNECIQENHHISFVTCDEMTSSLVENMDNYGFKASDAIKRGNLSILDFRPNFSDQVIGEFELDAVLLRIQTNLKGPKPILVIDSLQNLFVNLKTENNLASLLKIFGWCREKNITLLCTAAEGVIDGCEGYFEEYASDCVITICQKMVEKLMTRYLRVLKYRGTSHGTNEYPFLLTQKGVSIFPITNATLSRKQTKIKLSTNVNKLDEMLDGGFTEGSSIMISGTSGAAKSLLCATFAESCATKNKKILFFSHEESVFEYVQNVRSAGIDLETQIKNKKLFLKSVRSVEMGLEEHLISIIDRVEEFQPDILIIDPITSLLDMGTNLEVKALLVRFISYLKDRNITVLLTELLREEKENKSIIGLSSLVDTWIKLTLRESNGEFNRIINVIKSRGSRTSKQIKEFIITDHGLQTEDPYIGRGGIVFGSEKSERKIIDQQKHKLLEKQLKEIESQLKIINSNKKPSDDQRTIEESRFEFELLEKRNKITLGLQDIDLISSLNTKLREK